MSTTHQQQLRAMNDGMCRRLLESHNTGRLAFVEGGWPVVMPMNFRYFDGSIVMRTGTGSKLTHVPNTAAAIEIDGVGEYGQWGWSVLASGYALDVTDTLDRSSVLARDLPIWPMAPGTHEHWLLIAVERLTGRFFGEPPNFDQI